MNREAATLQIAEDGTRTIPANLTRTLRPFPRQTVAIKVRDDTLVLEPSRRDCLSQIGHLLRSALADVEWPEIKDGRRNRCF